MTVDILICTKNSVNYHKRFSILDACFFAIKKEIPYNKIILVDGYSVDDTVMKAKKYFGKRLEIIKTCAKLGKARQIGFEASDSEWIFVIDSDVIIPKGIWSHIKAFEYSAVECDYVNHHDDGTTITSKRRSRGILCATLIKKSFVEGIKIPDDMEVYEDHFIKKYIESKGGVWYPCNLKIQHFSKSPTKGISFKIGYFGSKYNLKPLSEVVGALILYHNSYYWNIFIGWLKGWYDRF